MGFLSETLHGHPDGCEMTHVNMVLGQVDMYVRYT